MIATSNQVVRLYLTVFAREPDEGGLAFWTNHLRVGTPLQAVADGFTAADAGEAGGECDAGGGDVQPSGAVAQQSAPVREPGERALHPPGRRPGWSRSCLVFPHLVARAASGLARSQSWIGFHGP